jgi:hypothetical protein
MKKFLCIALIVAVGSFLACRKSEDNKSAEGKQTLNTKQAQQQKRKKRPKAGANPPGLQIYQEEKLVIAIPREDYAKITKTTVKVEGQDKKAILLTDLLKAHNVSGKIIVLKGPNRTSSITWEQATANPIYLYHEKNRLQTYSDSKALGAARIPEVLVRINVGNESVKEVD